MRKERQTFSYPKIGEWLKETMRCLHLVDNQLIELTAMGRGTFFQLLKGGYQVQLLGTSFPHRHGVAQR